MNLMEIGTRIKKLREETNLTQTKVAEYLSLDQSMVAKMEKGERAISSDVIEKLSALFCCTEDYILLGKDSKQKYTVPFRKNTITADDLKAMSKVNKIVLNQFDMDKMLGGE